MRRRLEMYLLLALLAACQQTPDPAPPPLPAATAPFSLEALRADPEGYVDQRYASGDLPNALENDLSAQGFTCAPREAATECTLAQPVFEPCFDVWNVTITADAPVDVEVDRRCLGAMPPTER